MRFLSDHQSALIGRSIFLSHPLGLLLLLALRGRGVASFDSIASSIRVIIEWEPSISQSSAIPAQMHIISESTARAAAAPPARFALFPAPRRPHATVEGPSMHARAASALAATGRAWHMGPGGASKSWWSSRVSPPEPTSSSAFAHFEGQQVISRRQLPSSLPL